MNKTLISKKTKSQKQQKKCLIFFGCTARRSGRIALNYSFKKFTNTVDSPVTVGDSDDETTPECVIKPTPKQKKKEQPNKGKKCFC